MPNGRQSITDYVPCLPTKQDYLPPLAFRGVVTTYNAAGARVYVVPAAYDSLFESVAPSLKNTTGLRNAADEEGLDELDASDDYVEALSAGDEAAVDAALDALLDTRLRSQDVED